ncbi:MAG: hypothetical protein SGJ24_06245 [Chloroflexota bacterium]|nr:hypothetical protein [Chloroflexota bacterium]
MEGSVSSLRPKRTRDWLVAAIFLIVTLMLWMPFGFDIADISDTWVFFAGIEAGYFPVVSHDSRPFLGLMIHLAHALTPESWVGANVLAAALLFLRSVSVYALVNQIVPRGRWLAFASGILSLVSAADTGTYWVTALNVQAPIVAWLIAANLLLWHAASPRIGKLTGMTLALLYAMTYESVFLPIALTPFLLLLSQGREKWRWSALWVIVPALMLARYAYFVTQDQGGEYQASVLSFVPGEMLRALQRIYGQVLGNAWLNVVPTRASFSLDYALIAAVGALLTGFIGWSLRKEQPESRRVVILGILAFGLIGAGVAAILPTFYQDINYRTLFIAGVSGALLYACGLALLAWSSHRTKRLVFAIACCGVLLFDARAVMLAIIIGGGAILFLNTRMLTTLALMALVAMGLYSNLERHNLYVQVAARQAFLLRAMTRVVPDLREDAVLIFYDDTPDLRGVWSFEARRDVFEAAIRLLYADTTRTAAFCAPVEGWGFFEESCAWRDDGLVLSWARGETLVLYDKLVVVQYDDTVGVRLMEMLPLERAGDYAPRTQLFSGAVPTGFLMPSPVDMPAPVPFSRLR